MIDKGYGHIFDDGKNGDKSPYGIPSLMMIGPSSMMATGPQLTGDDFAYNEPGDSKIRIPHGMTIQTAIRALEQAERDLETPVLLNRTYRYLPDDGAVAADRVLKRLFGPTFGKSTMFRLPETRTVKLADNKSIQVAWGRITIPSLSDATINLCDLHPDPEYGRVFEIHVTVLKKHQAEIDTLFDEIEKELQENSIYRGQVLEGNPSSPQFKDLSKFDPTRYVFAQALTRSLNGTLWSVLRHPDLMLAEGISTKRAIMVEGDYGTGKSTLGLWTALIAAEHGWTVMFPRAGKDNIHDVMRAAKLYGRTVIVYEDIDKDTSSGESIEVSALLDAFDGPNSKDSEIVLFMTANHPERMIKGMLRPGRIDGVFTAGALDRPGVQKLIEILVPTGKLAPDNDYDAIYEAMTGFSPAFVNEAIKRAKTFAISAADGNAGYVLDTQAFVDAADSLNAQLAMLNDANEGEKRPTLATAMEDTVRRATVEALHGSRVRYPADEDGRDPETAYVMDVQDRDQPGK